MKVSTVIYTIIACILVTAICSYLAGRQEGARHAIEDSYVYVIQYSEDRRSFKVLDYGDVFVELDGEIYEHNF